MTLEEAMREIELGYRAASGQCDRRHYKIFYSHIHPFPLMTLGQNPGGPVGVTDLTASETYFENWEHDFVLFRNTPEYALARPMSETLASALGTRSVNVLRQIPATNVIFRRSPDTGSLSMSPSAAVIEARPFVSRIISIVSPICIVLSSKNAFDLFTRYHCRRGSVVIDSMPQHFTPNGANRACIYMRARGFVEALGTEVHLIMVGHPSKYASRAEWPDVVDNLCAAFHEIGLSQLMGAAALVELPNLPNYGVTI